MGKLGCYFRSQTDTKINNEDTFSGFVSFNLSPRTGPTYYCNALLKNIIQLIVCIFSAISKPLEFTNAIVDFFSQDQFVPIFLINILQKSSHNSTSELVTELPENKR